MAMQSGQSLQDHADEAIYCNSEAEKMARAQAEQAPKSDLQEAKSPRGGRQKAQSAKTEKPPVPQTTTGKSSQKPGKARFRNSIPKTMAPKAPLPPDNTKEEQQEGDYSKMDFNQDDPDAVYEEEVQMKAESPGPETKSFTEIPIPIGDKVPLPASEKKKMYSYYDDDDNFSMFSSVRNILLRKKFLLACIVGCICILALFASISGGLIVGSFMTQKVEDLFESVYGTTTITTSATTEAANDTISTTTSSTTSAPTTPRPEK